MHQARRRVHEGWNKLGEAKGGGVHENGIDNSKGKLTPTNQKTRRAKNRIAKPKVFALIPSSKVSELVIYIFFSFSLICAKLVQ